MRVYPTGEDQPLLPSFTLLYRQVVENVVYEGRNHRTPVRGGGAGRLAIWATR